MAVIEIPPLAATLTIILAWLGSATYLIWGAFYILDLSQVVRGFALAVGVGMWVIALIIFNDEYGIVGVR